MNKIREIRLFAYTLLISLFLYSSAFAADGYYCCHDYTMYQVTRGQVDFDGKSVKDLRGFLKKRGYTRHSYAAGSDWSVVNGWLANYDVIIVGESHSGFFWNGVLYNWTKAAPEMKIKAKLNKDTLQSLMNKYRKIPPHQPYKDSPVELWRILR